MFADGQTPIHNDEDVIDSREVIARIEYLESQREEAFEVARGDFGDDAGNPEDIFGDAEREELTALLALADEGKDYAPDWEYGETLIRDTYFVEYAQELAEDIGAIQRDAAWPYNHIDWDAAARELRFDYSAVDFNGVTYWVRA